MTFVRIALVLCLLVGLAPAQSQPERVQKEEETGKNGKASDLQRLDARNPGQAERMATGGRAWDQIGGMVMQGTFTEGGVPGKITKTIDLLTGHSRTVLQRGNGLSVSGFDGVQWSVDNGIFTTVDLPPLVEDARSQGFVDRFGWRIGDAAQSALHVEHPSPAAAVAHYQPEGASAVEVSFDSKSHLMTKVVIDSDDGPLTTLYSDWRRVGPVKIAFRQMQSDNTGEVTILQLENVQLKKKLEAGSLARAKASPHGRIVGDGNVPVPIILLGTHILVPAKVSGIETHLIFDTGAANYYSPSAAERFGLKVSGGINIGGIGESSTTGGFAVADRIAIGPAELRDENVIVAPTPFPNTPSKGNPGADGFAGFEFLAEFRTTIDYSNRTMTFSRFDQPNLFDGVKVPFYSDGHSIYVQAEVDGQAGLFRLDTGDGSTVTLFPNFAKIHNLYQDESGPVSVGGKGMGGGVSVRKIKLGRFTFAGKTFNDLPANISQNKAGAFASRSLAGNLGAGVLRCFRVTFDYSARVLTFSIPESSTCGNSDKAGVKE